MATSSYTKTINLKAVVDKSAIQRAEKDFDSLQFKNLFDDKSLETLRETYIDVAKKEAEIRKLEEAISEYRKIGSNAEAQNAIKTLEATKEQLELEVKEAAGATDQSKGSWKDDNAILKNLQETAEKMQEPLGTIINNFSESFTDALESATKKIGNSIKSFASDIISSVTDELDTLSQLMGISTTNVDINSQKEMMEYGLSSQDYYALTSAMSDMGLSGSVSDLIDDMYYMSDEQIDRLLEKVDYYGETYGNADVEMLESYNEFQETWQDFKQGLTDTLIKFLSDNKDTLETVFDLLIDLCNTLFEFVSDIMPILNGLLTAVNAILQGLSWLLGGGSSTTTASSDLLASRSVYNTESSNTEITVNNNFNGTMTETQYANIGQYNAEQLLRATQ